MMVCNDGLFWAEASEVGILISWLILNLANETVRGPARSPGVSSAALNSLGPAVAGPLLGRAPRPSGTGNGIAATAVRWAGGVGCYDTKSTRSGRGGSIPRRGAPSGVMPMAAGFRAFSRVRSLLTS
jgi:hypothetical protein